jgi:type I restriction enzyme M protein
VSVTAYHSFAGEVEASNTPTIRRLTLSRRHQLSPIAHIIFGDTLGDGKTSDGHAGKTFHYMLANPPFGVEWKPQATVVEKEHKQFGFTGRFGPGLPRIDNGALLFLLTMLAKRKPSPD